MRIYKRGSVWWYELVFDGQRIQKSTRTKNRRDAEQIAASKHAALAKGEAGIFERVRPPLFEDAMISFLAWSANEHKVHPATTKRYKTSSEPLLKVFRSMRLDQIKPADVERYKSTRLGATSRRTGRPISPACVNRELAALRMTFNHAIKDHLHLRNPISKATGVKLLAENNEQTRVLSFTEQRKYLEAATPTLRDVALLIVEQGCRPEEIYRLRGSEVFLDVGFLQIAKGKTKAARRRLELTAASKPVLEARIARYGRGFLFPKMRHGKLAETRKVGDGDKAPAVKRVAAHIPKVSNAHDRAVASSGVAPFRLYDLRHTFATRAAQAGVDLATLAALLGHSKLSMLSRYVHPADAHKASAMEKVAAHNAAQELREKAIESGMQLIRSA